MPSIEERAQRYTQALYDGKAAVMAVADAELAELRVEIARLALNVDVNRAKWKAAEAALRRVREIHGPVDAMNYRGGAPRPARVCTGCGTDDGNWQHWPCPTVRALADEIGRNA